MMTSLSPGELAENARRSYQAGDLAAAIEGFAAAAAAYAAKGDATTAAEMKNNQSVALLRNKQAQPALDAAWGTETVFREAGDARREGIALANQASALQALKRHNESIDYYSRAGTALEKAGEFDLRLEVMQLLAALHLRRFKIFDAILALQSGLAGIKDPTPRQRFMKKLLFIRL